MRKYAIPLLIALAWVLAINVAGAGIERLPEITPTKTILSSISFEDYIKKGVNAYAQLFR